MHHVRLESDEEAERIIGRRNRETPPKSRLRTKMCYANAKVHNVAVDAALSSAIKYHG